MCHVSCVTCHLSLVACHVSHVMCHMSHLFFYFIFFFFGSVEAYWSRVCYQRGLPCLIFYEVETWLLGLCWELHGYGRGQSCIYVSIIRDSWIMHRIHDDMIQRRAILNQTWTNTRNTSMPPGVLSFQFFFCQQIRHDGRILLLLFSPVIERLDLIYCRYMCDYVMSNSISCLAGRPRRPMLAHNISQFCHERDSSWPIWEANRTHVFPFQQYWSRSQL